MNVHRDQVLSDMRHKLETTLNRSMETIKKEYQDHRRASVQKVFARLAVMIAVYNELEKENFGRTHSKFSGIT